jgi:hypothetical protein
MDKRDVLGELIQLLERFRIAEEFRAIVRNAQKRTILVWRDDADRFRWLVDQAGLGDVITVKGSSFVAVERAIVIDEQALDAEMKRPRKLRVIADESPLRLRPGYSPALWPLVVPPPPPGFGGFKVT